MRRSRRAQEHFGTGHHKGPVLPAGLIYWQSLVGTHVVRGGIGAKFGQMGFENSPLGYPNSDESCTGSAAQTCSQRFQSGTILWKAGAGTRVTRDAGIIGAVVNKRRPSSPINRVPPDLVGAGSQHMRGEAAAALIRPQNAAANAWRHGFLVRYTKGYTNVTGYTFEPWHLRYVGVCVSTDMHNRGFNTFEQSCGLTSAPGC